MLLFLHYVCPCPEFTVQFLTYTLHTYIARNLSMTPKVRFVSTIVPLQYLCLFPIPPTRPPVILTSVPLIIHDTIGYMFSYPSLTLLLFLDFTFCDFYEVCETKGQLFDRINKGNYDTLNLLLIVETV